MKYLRNFTEESDFQTGKVEFEYPTVSYVNAPNEVRYMSEPFWIARYNVTSTTEPVRIICDTGCANDNNISFGLGNNPLRAVYYNGVNVLDQLVKERWYYSAHSNYYNHLDFTFPETGEQELIFVFKNAYEVNQITFSFLSTLIYVSCSKTIETLPKSLFYNTSSLKAFNIGSSVNNIGDMVFKSVTSLNSLTFDKKGKEPLSLGHQTFSTCTGITGIVELPERLVEMCTSTFHGCTNITELHIGSKLERIKLYNPRLATGMNNLEKIILKTVVPPTLVPADYDTFTAFSNTAKLQGLYVPAEAVDAYKAADGWSVFAEKIFPIE